jgi:hypothetical protein
MKVEWSKLYGNFKRLYCSSYVISFDQPLMVRNALIVLHLPFNLFRCESEKILNTNHVAT